MKKIPWGWVIVVLILIYVGALTLPYVAHKKVSSTFVKDFEKRSFTNDQAGTERVSYLNDRECETFSVNNVLEGLLW